MDRFSENTCAHSAPVPLSLFSPAHWDKSTPFIPLPFHNKKVSTHFNPFIFAFLSVILYVNKVHSDLEGAKYLIMYFTIHKVFWQLQKNNLKMFVLYLFWFFFDWASGYCWDGCQFVYFEIDGSFSDWLKINPVLLSKLTKIIKVLHP